MGGMTRLKGMGMFMAATWLGPALIMPIWSWVWKYMFEGRPARHKVDSRCHPPHANEPTAHPHKWQLEQLECQSHPVTALSAMVFLGVPLQQSHLIENLTIQSPLDSLSGAGSWEQAFFPRGLRRITAYQHPRLKLSCISN